MKNYKEKIIKINWNNPESIEAGENLKQELENKGFEQVKTISGVTYSKFIYRKYN